MSCAADPTSLPRGPGNVARTRRGCLRNIDALVRAAMESGHIPGLSLAVVKGDDFLVAKGYGLENVEVAAAATANTVYEIGSLSKQFTAAAVMQCVERGLVSLDERLMHFLLGLPVAWDDIRLIHLLTHTAGLVNYTSLPEFSEHTGEDVPASDVLATVFAYPMRFAPGTAWEYTNTGYFLLGLVLERVYGRPYGEILKEQLFIPSGMGATGVYSLREVTANRADGYEWVEGKLVNTPPVSASWSFASAGIASTVLDLARWESALKTGVLLHRATVEQMRTPVRLADGSVTPYGFGWFCEMAGRRRRVFHSGGIRGFRSAYVVYPDQREMAVVLTNLGDGSVLELAESVLRCL